MSKHKFELGNRIKDLVSGVEGITTGRIEYLNGCVQYNIIPAVDKDGKAVESYYHDQNQLVLIGEGITKQIKTGNPAGSKNTGAAPSQPKVRP